MRAAISAARSTSSSRHQAPVETRDSKLLRVRAVKHSRIRRGSGRSAVVLATMGHAPGCRALAQAPVRQVTRSGLPPQENVVRNCVNVVAVDSGHPLALQQSRQRPGQGQGDQPAIRRGRRCVGGSGGLNLRLCAGVGERDGEGRKLRRRWPGAPALHLPGGSRNSEGRGQGCLTEEVLQSTLGPCALGNHDVDQIQIGFTNVFQPLADCQFLAGSHQAGRFDCLRREGLGGDRRRSP